MFTVYLQQRIQRTQYWLQMALANLRLKKWERLCCLILPENHIWLMMVKEAIQFWWLNWISRELSTQRRRQKGCLMKRILWTPSTRFIGCSSDSWEAMVDLKDRGYKIGATCFLSFGTITETCQWWSRTCFSFLFRLTM